jgi:hypothetical protein
MTETPTNKHVCTLSTGKLFEHDMAANALKEKNIPFYKQMETSSGLRIAMPFQPAMGPGTYYNILVSSEFEEEAKSILGNLPIDLTVDPDLWHFGATETIKRRWKIYIIIFLAFSFVAFAVGILERLIV